MRRRGAIAFVAAATLAAGCTTSDPAPDRSSGTSSTSSTTIDRASRRPPTTTTSTTSTTSTTRPPDPAASALEPLLLPAPTGGAPYRRDDIPLDAEQLSARPLLSPFDDIDVSTSPPPDLALVTGLASDGFEAALRGVVYARSHPAHSTTTIVRFATPAGAASSAARITALVQATPGAVGGDPVDGIAGSTLVSVPTPQNVMGNATMAVAVFVVDRHLAIVVRFEPAGPLVEPSWITEQAVGQHERLVEAAASGGS